ncbi:hypothetical protein ACUSIJ_28840 [Pseudochelatococcus sp. B33]
MKKKPAQISCEEKAYRDQVAEAAERERQRAAMHDAIAREGRRDAAKADAAADRERYLDEREARKARIRGDKKPASRKRGAKSSQRPGPDLGERLFGVHPLAGYDGNIPVLEKITRKSDYGPVDMGYRNLASDPISRMIKRGQCNEIQAKAAQILSELYDAYASYPGMKWEAPVDGGGFKGVQEAALEAAEALVLVSNAAGIYGAMALDHVIARGAEVQDLVTLGIAPDARAAGFMLRNALDAASIVFGLREPPGGRDGPAVIGSLDFS